MGNGDTVVWGTGEVVGSSWRGGLVGTLVVLLEPLRLSAFPVKLPATSEISHPGIEFPKKSSVVLESR